MRKQSGNALIMIGFLLLLVACQNEIDDKETTAEPTAAIEEVTPPSQRPAGNERSGSGLSVWLEAPSSLPLGEPVKVQFYLVNESESDLYVLNWFTPLEGLGGDIFQVTRDGQRVRYQGPLASRGDPTPEAYTLIKAGGMASAEVDLSLAYDFSIPGTYTIEFISPTISHVAHTEAEMAQSQDELGPVDIPSNEVVVAIGA